ncbi:MAG: hypothetical protein M1825_000932 [Sarcosagium campestre]|nr:MAG: hypothetical protein M1825_000932 [Sarcosagium campestre]
MAAVTLPPDAFLYDGSQRPRDWYKGWTIGGNASSVRKSVGEELLDAVEKKRVDSQTLAELMMIIDFEFVCQRYEDRAESESETGAALTRAWTSRLMKDLSECLIDTINDTSHFERELQSRSLLSGLSLLRAFGVEQMQNDYFELLRNNFEKRSQDLAWQRTIRQDPRTFTRAKFRRVQCSYLLSCAAEYAKHFQRAQPIGMTALMTFINLAFFGVTVASIPMGGGLGSLQSSLSNLDSSLRPLWQDPNSDYQVLWNMQEVTRTVVALRLYAAIRDSAADTLLQADPVRSEMASSWSALATSVLEQLSLIISDQGSFEEDLSPPHSFWQHILNTIQRGPAAFTKYFFVYGLLDCVAQICRFVKLEQIPESFRNRLIAVMNKSKDDAYRWKALEILLADRSTRDAQRQAIPLRKEGNLSESVEQEIKVICECLGEEEGNITARRSSSVSPQAATASNESIMESTLSIQDWIESPLETVDLDGRAERFIVAVDGKPLSTLKKLKPSVHRPEKSKSSGLSPDCQAAFFLKDHSLKVFSLANLNQQYNEEMILEVVDCRKSLEYQAAAISNNYAALITRTDLGVIQIRTETSKGKLIGRESFKKGIIGSPWRADCVAIHEAPEGRVWITVGGRLTKDTDASRDVHGKIKMYRIDQINGEAVLAAHTAYFDRPYPDPLARDFIKKIDFSADGANLVCVTKNNCVLSWRLSNNARARQAPFRIAKTFGSHMTARGVTSAIAFLSVSSRPYVLYTTSPSNERNRHGGEWTSISPLPATLTVVPSQLENQLTALVWTKSIIMGAASCPGKIVALLEDTGKLMLLSLAPGKHGGLWSAMDRPVQVEHRLSEQEKSSATSIRFHYNECDRRLELFAVDNEGIIIRKRLPIDRDHIRL